MMVGRAPRRSAWSIAWMTPIFFVFMLVCTKAWVDGLLGRQYAWVKTARSSWSALDGVEQDLARVEVREGPRVDAAT
jgi:1,2-diacylglycerol 3-beta-glucosyltransferase